MNMSENLAFFYSGLSICMRPVTSTSSTGDWFERNATPLTRRPHNQSDRRRTCNTNYILKTDIINMRGWLVWLCALTVVATCTAQQQRQNYNNNKYENFNTDSIIQNDRILLAYYKCVMDKGPCTKDGKNFKRLLPETLSTACGRCSPQQKVVVRKLLLGIQGRSEPRFVELLDKYDPQRSNRDALYNFLVTGQ